MKRLLPWRRRSGGKMLRRLGVTFSLLLAAGCTDDPTIPMDPLPDEVPLGIRVENATDRDFESVLIQFSDRIHDYGRVAAKAVSPYEAVEMAFRYAYVEIELETESARIVPIDYFGETPLDPGRYTYRFTLNPNHSSPHDRLFLDLIVDESPKR